MMIHIFVENLASSSFLNVLVPLTALDYLTGVIAALITKDLSSKVGTKGLMKKIMLYLGVFSMAIVQQALPEVPWLLKSIVMFFIITEMISILENLERTGVRLPEKIFNVLRLKQQEHEKDTD